MSYGGDLKRPRRARNLSYILDIEPEPWEETRFLSAHSSVTSLTHRTCPASAACSELYRQSDSRNLLVTASGTGERGQNTPRTPRRSHGSCHGYDYERAPRDIYHPNSVAGAGEQTAGSAVSTRIAHSHPPTWTPRATGERADGAHATLTEVVTFSPTQPRWASN